MGRILLVSWVGFSTLVKQMYVTRECDRVRDADGKRLTDRGQYKEIYAMEL